MLGSKRLEEDYFKHNIHRFNHTLSYLINKYKASDKFSILDIGTSQFTFMLKNTFPNADIYTVDYDSVFLSRCKKEKIHFKKENLLSNNKILFNQRFDVITFLETLEHINGDHKKIINKVTKSLKSGGICILQTPNNQSLKNICLKYFSIFWKSGSTFVVSEGEFLHFKEYSQKELEKLIHSIPSTNIISSKLQPYYEHPNSTRVYRKNSALFTPILYLYYFITLLFPQLRIGLEIIFTKKWPSLAILFLQGEYLQLI